MDKNMAKISIITPVYKAEQFIKRCVDSVISQTYNNWELILVNDGSPDNSGAICNEYAKLDSRIKVFHKENGGVSSARNFALEQVNSNWITCLDADDEIQPIFLQSFFDGINNSINIDFAFLSDFICCKGSVQKSSRIAEPKVFNNKEFVHFIENYIDYPALKGVHANFFKTEIIKNNNIKFDTNIRNGEDHIFVLEYLTHVRSAQIIEGNGYIYYMPYNYSLKYAPTLDELKYKFFFMEKFMYQLSEIYSINLDWAIEAKWLNGLSCIDVFKLYQPTIFKEYLNLYYDKLHSNYETDIRCNRDIRTINTLFQLIDNKKEKKLFNKLLNLFLTSPKTPLKYIKTFPITSKIAILIAYFKFKIPLKIYILFIKRIMNFRKVTNR